VAAVEHARRVVAAPSVDAAAAATQAAASDRGLSGFGLPAIVLLAAIALSGVLAFWRPQRSAAAV
jgi:hypothetical protein